MNEKASLIASDQIEQRRQVIKMAGLSALAFSVAGQTLMLTPSQAYAQSLPFNILSDEEAKVYAQLADLIVPGAKTAGVAHFLDQQLAVPFPDSLLMIKLLDMPPPYPDLYKSCLQGLNSLAKQQHGKAFYQLDNKAAMAMVGELAEGKLEGWQGPPSFLFYLTVRADGLDVVYGTPEGFELLNVPYMAHIMPPEGTWS